MSKNDPTDEELEREAARDVPLGSGGTPQHRPRLSDETRAVSLAEMRVASHGPQDRVLEEAVGAHGIRERSAAEQRAAVAPENASGDRQRQAQLAALEAMDRAVEAISARRAILGRGRRLEGMQATPPSRDAEAWDRYLVAGLVHLAPLDAIDVADALLEERRQRFG